MYLSNEYAIGTYSYETILTLKIEFIFGIILYNSFQYDNNY